MTLAEFVLLFRADTKGLAKGLKGANAALSKTATFVKANRETFANLGRGATIAGAAITGALALGVRSAVRFQNQMAMVSTMVRDTDRWMGEFSDGIREMSVQFGQTTDSLSKGLFDILSAGVETEKALGVLEAATMTAVGGFTRAEVTTSAMLTALKAFRLEAADATHVSDVMFSAYERGRFTIEQLSGMLGIVSSTAATAGLTFEETAAALATITRTGVPAEMTATALNSAITMMRSPAEAATKAAKELGIGFDDAAVKERGFLGILEDIMEASPTEAQLSALFPNVRARKAIDAIRLDMAGFRSDVEAGFNSAGLAAQSYAKATETTAFRMKQLRETVEEFMRDVGGPLLKWVGGIVKGLTGFFNRLGEISPRTRDFAIKATALAGALLLVQGRVFALVSRIPDLVRQFGLLHKITTVSLLPAFARLTPIIRGIASSSKLAALSIGGIYAAILILTTFLVVKAIKAFKDWRQAVRDAREAQESFDDVLSKAPENFMEAAAASKAYRDQGVKNIKDIEAAIKAAEAAVVALSAEENRAAKTGDEVRAAVMSRRKRREADFLRTLRKERDQRVVEVKETEETITDITDKEIEKRKKAEEEAARKREESIRHWLAVYSSALQAGVEAFRDAQDTELAGIRQRKEEAIAADFNIRRTVVENAELTNEERQAQLEALIKAEKQATDAVIFTDKEMAKSRRAGAKAMLETTLNRIVAEIAASAVGAIADATIKGGMTLGASLLWIPSIIAAELGAKALIKGIIASFQKGGLVPMTGPYMLHKGETVVPATGGLPGVAVTVNIGPVAMTSDLDVERVADRVGVIVARNIRRRRRF